MVMVLFTILFLQQLLFQDFNFWPLNRGWLLKWRFNCIYKIFKQFNGFSLCYQSWPICKGHSTTLICISVESVFWGWWQWKWCCCPSRTGKIVFKVGMSLNEFFACCSYKYCYLWWGFNSVYRGSPLAHVLHSLSSWIALSLVYAYLTWAEKRKEIDSFVKSHPYASLLLSEWKRTLQHFSTVSMRW